jgi:hypothetical protein
MAPTNNGKSAFLIQLSGVGRGDEDELSSFGERVQVEVGMRDMAMAMAMRAYWDGNRGLQQEEDNGENEDDRCIGNCQCGIIKSVLVCVCVCVCKGGQGGTRRHTRL